MKLKNRAMYLAAVLFVFLLGMTMSAQAASLHKEGDFYYSMEFGKSYVEGYCGSSTNIVIPTTLGGCPVKGIWNVSRGDGNTYSKAESLYIPDTVEEVTCSLGSGHKNLKTVRFSSNQTTVGDLCSFRGCTNLESVTNTQGITSLSYAQFEACKSLKSVSFPNVTLISGGNVFMDCSSMVSASFPNLKKPNFGMFQDCSMLSQVTFSPELTELPSSLFSGCSSLTAFTIPNTCTEVMNWSFAGTSISSIYVPSSVTHLNHSAFLNCTSLKTAVLDMSCDTLHHSAFSGCTNLESVTLPENLRDIRWTVFKNCINLKTITIPHTVTRIYGDAFSGCERLCEIRGYKGTEAENFANSKGIPFTGLDPEIHLSHSEASLYATGGFNKLTLGVRRNGTSAAITFKSSKNSVATVSSDGVITAKKAGKATITVKCGFLKKTCKITVKKSKITVKTKPVTLKKGKTKQIKLALTPNGKVTYKTTNKRVATVTKSGKIKAKKKGICYIKISMKGATTRKLKVRVK